MIARAFHALGIRVLAAETGGKRTEDCAANRALALSSGIERLEPDAPWPVAGMRQLSGISLASPLVTKEAPPAPGSIRTTRWVTS